MLLIKLFDEIFLHQQLLPVLLLGHFGFLAVILKFAIRVFQRKISTLIFLIQLHRVLRANALKQPPVLLIQ